MLQVGATEEEEDITGWKDVFESDWSGRGRELPVLRY
jgi:hypothetical protein